MTGIATEQSSIAIGFSFPIITAVLIALRFHTRWHQNKELQIDDWLCLPAWLCLAGCNTCLLTGIFMDAFVDQPITMPDDVTPGQRLLAQVVFALVKLYVVSNMFIKLTILYLYRRIFLGKWFNRITLGLVVLSVIWGLYAFIASVLYCGETVLINAEGGWAVCPRWGFALQGGTFIGDTVIDFCLLVLPIPFVWKLQLAPVKKFLIVVVFLLGGFAFIASLCNTIIQLVNLIQPAAAADGGKFFQGSWLLFYNWPCIEIGVGLIACNLPVISFRASRALFRHLKRGWTFSFGSLRRGSLPLEGHPIEPQRRNTDTNIRWPGNKGMPPTWYRTFKEKRKTHSDISVGEDEEMALKRETAIQLSAGSGGAGGSSSDEKDKTMDSGYSAPSLSDFRRAESPQDPKKTTRYRLEQTDARLGVADKTNGKVIGSFDFA